jgi:hypothetical protein
VAMEEEKGELCVLARPVENETTEWSGDKEASGWVLEAPFTCTRTRGSNSGRVVETGGGSKSVERWRGVAAL